VEVKRKDKKRKGKKPPKNAGASLNIWLEVVKQKRG
jgi:hypothetical protein